MPRNFLRRIRFSFLLMIVGGISLSGCMRPHISMTWVPTSWGHRPNLTVPDMYPLGNVVRSHYHVMQANGEATDFILYNHEFVGLTAELSPDGKDHVMEIGARMRSAPFPVIIERSEHNSNPELDRHRQQLIVQILNDFGNADAAERTFVAPAYGKGTSAIEAEVDWYRHLYSRRTGGGGSGSAGSGAGGASGGGASGGGASGGSGFGF